jgi:WD40 repeat protein
VDVVLTSAFRCTTGDVLATIQLDGAGVCVRLLPSDPAVVFVGGASGLLLKCSIATVTRAPLQGHTDGVLGLCVSEDGAALASGGDDRTVRLWDTATSRCLWTSDKRAGCVRSLAMHGYMVYCGVDNFNTVGLRRSDGSAGSTFGKTSIYPYGLAVTTGEAMTKFLRREKRELVITHIKSVFSLLFSTLGSCAQLQSPSRTR